MKAEEITKGATFRKTDFGTGAVIGWIATDDAKVEDGKVLVPVRCSDGGDDVREWDLGQHVPMVAAAGRYEVSWLAH